MLMHGLSVSTLAEGANMGVFTWHYYPTQSERCALTTSPSSPEANLMPSVLDEIEIGAAEVEALRDAYAPQTPLWLGESGTPSAGASPACPTPSQARSGGWISSAC